VIELCDRQRREASFILTARARSFYLRGGRAIVGLKAKSLAPILSGAYFHSKSFSGRDWRSHGEQ
jgi:hypothetical protein